MTEDNNSNDSNVHDNDADSKPYIRQTARSKHSEVEVVVEGAEGESISEIKDVAQERFEQTQKRQEKLREKDNNGSRKQYK